MLGVLRDVRVTTDLSTGETVLLTHNLGLTIRCSQDWEVEVVAVNSSLAFELFTRLFINKLSQDVPPESTS